MSEKSRHNLTKPKKVAVKLLRRVPSQNDHLIRTTTTTTTKDMFRGISSKPEILGQTVNQFKRGSGLQKMELHVKSLCDSKNHSKLTASTRSIKL